MTKADIIAELEQRISSTKLWRAMGLQMWGNMGAKGFDKDIAFYQAILKVLNDGS